jgi:hypothetical protein
MPAVVVSDALPPMPLTVPPLELIAPVSCPFWIVPPPCRLTPPFCVCVVPPRSRIAVAPLTVVALLVFPPHLALQMAPSGE